MASAKIFRINYKSDFILTLVSDAGWMTPFCIKFWTGAPSQAYYVQWDGETYTHCAPVAGEPTKLQVQFDDHHLPIGDLKYQVAYHFTVDDFPNDTEDEVLNQANITTEIDGEDYQVMLDFNGETAPEIQFSLPAYANEAQRIANEEQRIANEQARIEAEQQRIDNEQTRQDNEAQRIAQETARVNEYAELKANAVAATNAANDAATLAAQKAQLAADKAALADAAATLAAQKAQLAADKAALADAAATLANQKAALAQQKAQYAQTQGDYAKAQGDYAKEQGEIAEEDHERAEADHTRAESDHATAGNDHTQAGTDHSTAVNDHTQSVTDHTQADTDHTRAESDHTQAASDHTQAGADHTRAENDHSTASADHTQAGQDHTRAESDHTRAESDHAAVELYIDSLGAFDISAYHATGGVLAKYADLTAALGTNGANIPEAIRKGGMSVKFVQTYDNTYVQYMYIGTAVTGTPNPFLDVTNWEKTNLANEINGLIEVKLTNLPYFTGTTYPTSKDTGDYYSTKFKVPKGSKVIICGYGGNDFRLWAIYDSSKSRTRVADASTNTLSNPLTLTLVDDETYIVINTRKVNLSDSYVRIDTSVIECTINLQEEVDESTTALEGQISGLTAGLNGKKSLEHLDIINDHSFVGGTTVGTSTLPEIGESTIYHCQIFNVRHGEQYRITGKGTSGTRLWYVYDKNRILTRVAVANEDTRESPLTITIGNNEAYLVVNLRNNATPYYIEYLSYESTIAEHCRVLANVLDGMDAATSIERKQLKSYMNIHYNDGDYSYSLFSRFLVGLTVYEFQLPEAISVNTPVDNLATTRTIEYANNPSYIDSRKISLDLTSEKYNIVNIIGGKHYYYRIYKDNNTNSVLSSGDFETGGQVRELRIPANSNFDHPYIDNVRDLGGWPTSSGTKIRYGVIMRGNELNHDNNGVITSYIGQDGVNELLALGVSAELDLRGGDYSESAIGSDVAYANIPVDLFFFRLNIYYTVTQRVNAFVTAIRQLVTWIKAGKCIYIHCQGGCDRTGALCAFIEGICGVSENDINHDYEISNRDRSREYYTVARDGYDGDFKFAMEYIKGLLEYSGHIYVYYRGSYYDAQATVENHSPVALTDASLLTALGALSFGTLKERFHRLMKLGGMTEREMEELEMLLCS